MKKRPVMIGSKAIPSSPRSPAVATSLVMSVDTSRNGFGLGVPLREFRILISPPCSTTNRRLRSPGGAVKKTGAVRTEESGWRRKLFEGAGGGERPPPSPKPPPSLDPSQAVRNRRHAAEPHVRIRVVTHDIVMHLTLESICSHGRVSRYI